jgi:hypothetical protein
MNEDNGLLKILLDAIIEVQRISSAAMDFGSDCGNIQKIYDVSYGAYTAFEDRKRDAIAAATEAHRPIAEAKRSMSGQPANPPAFPCEIALYPVECGSNKMVYGKKPGMTIRDYFAGEAMQGWRSNPNGKYTTHQDAADEAYRYADAMLRVRSKTQEEV